MKPYYEEGGITIYHGDCRDFHGGVECVVTSPPYNVGIEYDEHNDAMPWLRYFELVSDAASMLARAIVPTGRTWVNVAPVVQAVPGGAGRSGGHSGRATKMRVSLLTRWGVALEEAGLQPADAVAWCSMRGSGTAWGSYEMPSAPNLRGDWETILVHYKMAWTRTTPPGMEHWRDTLGKWPALVSNVWQIRTAGGTLGAHPAAFPYEVPARAIRLSTWPGETVLDPFMGTGTTLLAAKNLGRKAIGIELSERYCEIAAKRLAQGVFDLFPREDAS